jgi:lysine-N-methylase
VDIDDESYERYINISGEFGDRLRADMTLEDGYHTFVMNGERCPFLNEKNLCDIYINIGEDALCGVCTEYPRFGEQYGNVLEKGLGLSCEEAGRIILSQSSPVKFIEEETTWKTTEEIKESVDNEDDILLLLTESRKIIIKILQNRLYPIEERIVQALNYARSVQECINRNVYELPDKDINEYVISEHETDTELILKSLDFFSSLDPMEEDWKERLDTVKSKIAADNGELIKKALNADEECCGEQIAVYFIYRYYLQAVYDNDAYSKVRFMALSYIIIRAMNAAYSDENGETELAYKMENARSFSANIEHSQANMDAVNDELIFNEEYGFDGLTAML